VIKNSKVVIYYKNIKLCDNTATGGEVYPCKAKLESNQIIWSCFMGMHEPGISSKMKYWLFNLNNQEFKVWSDIK
ncbi:MAG: hypothetical protein GWO87_02565, partial [Xanthomonadaceae bacterium]|nr:hypothetical protein [Rhodospirillaceae bacterium]NIA18048.1 hypothetical protein [Xanthomonadaceae bacterium]